MALAKSGAGDGSPKSRSGLFRSGPLEPGYLTLAALATAGGRRVAQGWSGSGLRTVRLDRSRGPNLIATPRDFRPTNPDVGRAMLAGRFVLAGAELETGVGGDPWDRASPSRPFARELHRFSWLPHLLTCGESGAREALRLFLEWRRLFYRPNPFVWSGEVLERRMFNLACGAKRMAGVASDAEAAILFNALLHQATYLSGLQDQPARKGEQACAVIVATSALNGRAGERLAARDLARLARALPETVLADGGMRSRSPEAGLELLLDLLTLDDLLLQRGRETPVSVTRAIDRLGSALRFFTLGDGCLASFQGGGAADPERVRAALNQDDEDGRPSGHAPHTGYHRLSGPNLQVLVDAGAPADGAFAVAACAQPLAMEVVCGTDRIFANSGWTPDAPASSALRLTAAACTAELDQASAGRPLKGFPARVLGPRLLSAARDVEARRNENENGGWLALAHDGWARRFGLIHERRLYVDSHVDELRGEDVFSGAKGRRSARSTPYCIRFHTPPGVQVSIARDGRSVLLRGPSNRGWWFRNDASRVAIEPSVHVRGGVPRRSVQVVLSGLVSAGETVRVRWKMTPVEPAVSRASSRKAPLAAELPVQSAAAPDEPQLGEAVDQEVLRDEQYAQAESRSETLEIHADLTADGQLA